MLENILQKRLFCALSASFNLNFVYELRLRLDAPIVVNFGGKNYFLRDKNNGELVYCSESDIDFVLAKSTENSIYACNGQIKQGFITCDGGIRIGLGGELVIGADGKPQTIKNISSLNIRVPHQNRNCAHTALTFMLNGGLKNTLIIAPPGAGKTTFLRDIAYSLASVGANNILNVMVADERCEICAVSNRKSVLSIGATCDVISGTTKEYAFNSGIRALKPDVIICDELATQSDAFAVKNAINSGVKVVATAHGVDESSILCRPELSFLLKEKLFERIVILSARNGAGTYEKILNENLSNLYRGDC